MFYFSQRSTLSNHPVFWSAVRAYRDDFFPCEAPKIFGKPRRILVPVAVFGIVLCRDEVPDVLEKLVLDFRKKLVLPFEPYLIDICG